MYSISEWAAAVYYLRMVPSVSAKFMLKSLATSSSAPLGGGVASNDMIPLQSRCQLEAGDVWSMEAERLKLGFT